MTLFDFSRVFLLVVAGMLSLTAAARAGAAGRRRRPGAGGPGRAPDVADEKYGEHKAQAFDLWLAKSEKPTPLVVFIHGGGFRGGNKKSLKGVTPGACLEAGISYASIEYRLTGIGHYPMQHHDCARALQYIRHNAAKWNLDKIRVAATGGSAGAGLSLWLGFHDDLADPKAEDPVARESTRITCALPINAQCTYDPKMIREIVPGNAYDHPALKALFGVAADFDWTKDPIPEAVQERIRDCGPLSLLTEDDCPVYFQNQAGAARSGNIHHPNFGKHLEAEMKKLGLECVRRLSSDYPVDGKNMNEEMLAWIKKHFKM
jgi:acetyl esterase/lipase